MTTTDIGQLPDSVIAEARTVARERKAYLDGRMYPNGPVAGPNATRGAELRYPWPTHTIRREPPASVKVANGDGGVMFFGDGVVTVYPDGMGIPVPLAGASENVKRAVAALLLAHAEGGAPVTVEVFVTESGDIGTREVA